MWRIKHAYTTNPWKLIQIKTHSSLHATKTGLKSTKGTFDNHTWLTQGHTIRTVPFLRFGATIGMPKKKSSLCLWRFLSIAVLLFTFRCRQRKKANDVHPLFHVAGVRIKHCNALQYSTECMIRNLKYKGQSI